jgi:hypothetical protein
MKKLILILAGLVLSCAFFGSCNKPEPEPAVTLKAPVIAAMANGNEVTVSWTAVINATAYKVEYKKATAAEYIVAGTATYSPYRISNLEFGNVYAFRVKATNGEVESDWSNVVTVDVYNYLPAPVIRTTAGITYVNVAWDSVEGAASYQLEHKETLGSDWKVDYTGDGADIENVYRVDGLESGVSYDFRVGAIAEGYSMSYSEISTVATTDTPGTMISNAAQLVAWLSRSTPATDEVVALTNDIDMDGVSITSASGFAGIFEGQGFSIKNLASSVPLFAENSGHIRNLTIDASCAFAPEVSVFGALVALDKGGKYTSVKNEADITITATSDITENLAIGGLVGASCSDIPDLGSIFNLCSNSGAITIAADAYSHKALAMGGILGYARLAEFKECTNNGPLTLRALYGDPFSQWSYSAGVTTYIDGNMSIGGILGRGWDITDDYDIVMENCENLQGGTITLLHSAIEKLGSSSVEDEGCMNVAGVMGQGNGSMKKCLNHAEINAVGVSSDGKFKEMRNYILRVGGILGTGYRGTALESCSNRGPINVQYSGSWEKQTRDLAAVGGICGRSGYNKSSAKAYFCTNHGPITVTGKGTLNIGGIFGAQGYQRGNKVYATAKMDVLVRKAYVGGLQGFADGASAQQHIKSSWCEADITARSVETSRYNLATGGLVGFYGFGQSGSSPTLVWVDGEGPCHYKGNISTPGQFKTGMAVGWVNINDKIHVYGSAENPIELSGTLEREELEKTTITADNVFSGTYSGGDASPEMFGNLALGIVKGTVQVTIHATCK